MDFDKVKENIQPLAVGRNVSLLQASLSSHHELAAQRTQLEEAIKNYVGDDPLEPWYTYICWIEQSYPSGGSESGLQKVLNKCLTYFDNEKYKQDRRLIKLFIKFMESQRDKEECYQQMYNCGFGTMVADFYIAWAYCYDLKGNTRKADEIFRRGIACRAEPLEDLKEAHQHYGFSLAQRILYSDGDEANNVNQELNERRLALQSLHKHRTKGTVGSVRTGAAIKNQRPGVVSNDAPSTSRGTNAGRIVTVFNDENKDNNAIIPPKEAVDSPASEEEPKTTLSAIVDAVREQENKIEAVPWNKALEKGKHKKLFPSSAHSELGFSIHTDETTTKSSKKTPLIPPITNYDKRIEKLFVYPSGFKSKNIKQSDWPTPVTIEQQPDTHTLPNYNKVMLYPRPNIEFQPEEWLAYKFFKKRDISNKFVERQESYWSIGNVNANVRKYPNFVIKSKPQILDGLDTYYKPPIQTGLRVKFHEIYNDDENREYQLEELLVKKWKESQNDTIHSVVDMEETVCITSENLPRRKSFFPTMAMSRKSIAPRKSIMTMPIHKEQAETINAEKLTLINSENESKEQQDTLELEKKRNVTPQMEHIFSPPSLPSPITNESKEEVPPEAVFLQPPTPTLTTPLDEKTSPNALATTNTIKTSTATTSIFDADETCSTHMFNIFIKTQSVSTPKAPQKQATGRQFGTLLKDVTPPSAELPAVVDDVGIVAEANSNSPGLRKQLSTILETSEHATHSSGGTNATTKATLNSPKSDTAQHITKTEHNTIGNTPAVSRLERQNAFHFTVFEDSVDAASANVSNQFNPAKDTVHGVSQPKVGNFTHFEQREDTAPIIPIRFQEDKTETITKTILRFQEDKTETLSKMMLPNKNAPPLPSTPKMETDQRTGNASKLGMLAPTLPAIEGDDDIFAFLSKTPEKEAKPFSQLKATNLYSPLVTAQSKRICNQTTPDLFAKTKPKIATDSFALFEDEINEHKKPTTAALKPFPQLFGNKSYMPDFSLSECTQPKPVVAVPAKQLSIENLGDSFMSNLSFVPETQEVKPEEKAKNNFEIFHDESILTLPEKKAKPTKIYLDCTLPETQELLAPNSPQHAPIRLSSAKDKENAPSQSMVWSLKQMAKEEKPAEDIEDSFMKDISAFSQPSSKQKDQLSMNPAHLTASFMKDLGQISKQPEDMASNSGINLSLLKAANNTALKFRDETAAKKTSTTTLTSNKSDESLINLKPNNYFELNAATEMFATNISMIKNSTLLPNHERTRTQQQEPTNQLPKPQQQIPIPIVNITSDSSIHLTDDSAPSRSILLSNANESKKQTQLDQSKKKQNTTKPTELNYSTRTRSPVGCNLQNATNLMSNDDGDLSIYYKKTPRTPKAQRWNETDMKTPEIKHFVHQEINPDQTMQVVSKNVADPNVNPFNADLINAFLEYIDFTNYILNLPTCQLVGHVKQLSVKKEISIQQEQFIISKVIGQGAYGSVYCGKHKKTGKTYAFKQERPPNYWEYYICLEVQSRITSDEMAAVYMNIDYALIGNNSSIFVSDFSPYGSLIAVCNKVKKCTTKNVDEYVVMHLACQLLSIIDHLHAINIIHADVKADNFLLMKPLMYPSDEICLQLIDFGVSIDMKQFPEQQTFNYVHNQNDFNCVEMRMRKPWNYQLDLYGLAGVIHVLLFGKYMDIEERGAGSGVWMPKHRFPRYFNKFVWESIFRTLLNIRDCTSMPNLQELRTILKSELAEKEKYVQAMVQEFNGALRS